MAKEGSNAWLWGCVGGCLGVLLLFAAGLTAIVYFSYQGAQKARPEIAKNVKAEYDSLVQQGKVPEDVKPIYDDLVARCQDPSLSFWTLTLLSTSVMMTLQDGTVTADERKLVEEVRDFLAKNPDASVLDIQRFMKDHPGMSASSPPTNFHFETTVGSASSAEESHS